MLVANIFGSSLGATCYLVLCFIRLACARPDFSEQELLKRRVWTLYNNVILICLVQQCSSLTQTASRICDTDPTDANNIIVTFKLLPKSDNIFDVYAYDAATGDTKSTANRKTACTATKPLSAITDPTTEAVTFVITVDTTSTAVHTCGVAITGTTVKSASLLFRAATYENVVTIDDAVYKFSCSMDKLNAFEVSTLGETAGSVPVITLTEPNRGVYMRVLHDTTNYPASVVAIGDSVYLSLEFVPGQDKGLDNWGTHFFIGFLGNDVITGTSASSLFILVQPRYAIDTYISVTSALGTEEIITNSVHKFELGSDLMGCSDGGVAELMDKGVEIVTSHEAGVLVYNTDVDTSGTYTALPVDVSGTDYYTVSVPAAGEASEFMVIATEDSTAVDVTLPVFTSLSVNANITKAAGETLSLNMQKRQTLHIAQTSPTLAESVIGYHIVSDKPVSVISGNRNHANDHIVEQIPPTTQLGGRYVLVPVDIRSDGRSTVYNVQATQSGDTVVKRYTSMSAFDTHTINVNTDPPLMITLTTDPCELEADKPILVTQIVQPPTGAAGFDPAMLVMPSVQQWSYNYLVYSEYKTKVLYVFPSAAAAGNLAIGGNSLSLQPAALTNVVGPRGYKFYDGNNLPAKLSNLWLKSTNAVTLFMPLVYQFTQPTPSNVGLASLPFGYRYPANGQCVVVLPAIQGDQIDNDCDGLIDEELVNTIDEDGDGDIDEDTVATAIEFVNVVNIRMTNCMVSGPADFSNSKKLFSLTGSDGCATNGKGPFKPQDECTLVSGTGTQRKVFNCGLFEVAMFEDEKKLNFKCDLDVCYSSTDTKCTTICNPSGRKKRQEDNGDVVTNVTTDVWVLPNVNVIRPPTVSGSDVDAMTFCLENTSFRIVAITLGLLSLVSFLTALCFCCLFRRNRNHQKSKPRRGKPC